MLHHDVLAYQLFAASFTLHPSGRAADAGNGDSGEYPDWFGEFLASVGNQADFRELTTEQIEEAMNRADGWRSDKKIAMAAVIAAHCEYNPNTIDIYTSTMGFDPTVYEYAIRIAEAHQGHPQGQ